MGNKQKEGISELGGKRGQILRTLLKSLGSKGIPSITMRGLAKDAGVATKTIYNLFGSKDALISEIIRHTYRERMALIKEANADIDAFEQLTKFVLASAQFNVAEAEYSHAVVYAYYSADESLGSFHHDMHDYIGGELSNLLEDMKSKGELESWSSPKVIARQIIESMISSAAEWTIRSLSDEEFIDVTLVNVLTILYVHLTSHESEVKANIKLLNKKLEQNKKRVKKAPGKNSKPSNITMPI